MDAAVPKNNYIYIRCVTDASVYQVANYDKESDREKALEAVTPRGKYIQKKTFT